MDWTTIILAVIAALGAAFAAWLAYLSRKRNGCKNEEKK